MISGLDAERLRTLDDLRAFLGGNDPVAFRPVDRRETYAFVRRVLVRFRHAELPRAGKGLVKEFLGKVTGLSRAQLTRLVGQHARTGRIEDRRRGPARPFERRYTAADIRLLAEVDEALGDRSGPATRRTMQREFEEYGRQPFERLAGLSNSHLYRLRGSKTYRGRRTRIQGTRATRVAIGASVSEHGIRTPMSGPRRTGVQSAGAPGAPSRPRTTRAAPRRRGAVRPWARPSSPAAGSGCRGPTARRAPLQSRAAGAARGRIV